ncbi:hypothetical protein [Bradyrhizobium sp. B117]|uniref:hypothetical protein n=1 Tax=Bradyrhizobium sp. B117 TaxID=3140246 RepID=UPI0031834139
MTFDENPEGGQSEACPPNSITETMVGTAQARLCPPYEITDAETFVMSDAAKEVLYTVADHIATITLKVP